MKQHLFTLLVLAAAVALYAIGMGTGAAALLLVGGALELWFWVRVMRRARSSAVRAPAA